MWKDQEVKYKTQKFKSSSKLEAEYKSGTELHRKKIEWIMCKDICLFIKVLEKVVKFSKVSHPEKIADCDRDGVVRAHD